MQDIHLPFPRHLATPSRDDLLRIHRQHERHGVLWLVMELAIVCGCITWIVAGGGPSATAETVVLSSVSVLGLFDFLPGLWAANRKLLRDIRADARFGPHSRDSLLECVDRVASTLGIRRCCPVYLIRDKEINASAVPIALLPGIGSLAAVHLNRSVLHLLDEAELESVIGHELGHVFIYPSLAGRCMLIHAVFAASVTLVLSGLLADTELRLVSPLLALLPARWLAFSSSVFRTRAAEFLCDDCGAEAGGREAAMMSHIKIAIEQETRASLIEQLLEARLLGADIPMETLMATYTAALPFGVASPAEARIAIQQGIESIRRGSRDISLLGFWRFVVASDDVDEGLLREMLERRRAVRAVGRVSIRPQDVIAGRSTVKQCISAIEDEPTKVFVHLPDEIEDRNDTHPNTSRRLLFLWRCRRCMPQTGSHMHSEPS